ncbi:M16 family metallopeptidase [Hyalangium versicolor]|uniref:M16 family metallopeptidase n=1 Tax=Hyalangium versicolor TaxID=2861190 RepID=UPI001CCC28C6|nr:pitrilysin family protein [Hyalangium versicolor]
MRRVPITALALAIALALPAAAESPAPQSWKLPVFVKKLPNGLTVVVSPDHSTPTFGISTVYRIGFRLEPKGRTGFAHLFEHMMFQGTPNAPKGILGRVIQGGGGVLNGSTRYDHTNYIASAPVSALDAILWLEADRMKGLDFSEKNLKNQQDVVKEEIRGNVLNRPYGLFYWTDIVGKAFDKWENSHDGYGSFTDLDAANIADVKSFFETYYAPNNAVIGISGDVEPQEVFAKVEKYFGALPSRAQPKRPDVSEGANTAERWVNQTDALAQVPGLAVGFKLPGRTSQDYVPAAVLGELLAGGNASRLYQGLVKGSGTLSQIQGGLNWPLGDAWEIEGPTMMTFFGLYKPETDAKAVVTAMGDIISRIAKEGVPAEELARVKTNLESNLYADIEAPLSRANKLALTQLFTGDAAKLNDLPTQIRAVTSEDIRRVASTWLAPTNRTVIDRRPAKVATPQAAEGK